MEHRKKILTGLLLLVAAGACAQEGPRRFSTPEQAQQVIDRVILERARINQGALREEQGCYEKFLTTACLDRLRDRRRAELGKLRDEEVQARAFQRKYKADQRDAALEEKRVADERDAREREADVKAREEALERKRLSSEERQREAAARPAAPAQDPRVQKFEQDQRERQSRAAQDEEQRRRNVEAYERKRKEAEEKQREVARRLQELGGTPRTPPTPAPTD